MKRETIASIEIANISFETQNGTELFYNFSLQLPLNEIVWLKGESGSGKSVLIKMICGLLVPTQGDILINGQALSEMTFEEFSPLRCNMGYSFDFGGLINNRNIASNLLFANEYHNFEFGTPDQLAERVAAYMETFNLQKVAYERPSSIVGGLRKAACVARAFIHEPELLLLDDPTTGLRGEVRARLKDLILAKKSKGEIKHVLVATDDAEFMKDLGATVIELKDGKVNFEKRARAA